MIRTTFSVMRDFKRLRTIAGIAMKYGWGDVAQRLGKGSLIAWTGRRLAAKMPDDIKELPVEVRIRLAIQELGPTFIKLGQLLATRPDVFPPAWINEFAKLQDHVPSVSYEALLPEMEKALGRSPEEVFLEFQTKPIAAASIAQVHLAKLQDGTPVVLKVRRPNVAVSIEADLRLLSHLGRVLESEFPQVKRFQLGKIIGQFSKSLRRELDLALEGRNTERFTKNFEHDSTVKFANIYWEYSCDSILVMDYIHGIPGNDLDAARQAGLDLALLAKRGANAVLKMVLVDGFFHADPHPGNIFYLPDNQLAIIDCGMVGRITIERRNEIADLLSALVSRDVATLRDTLISWAGDVEIDEDKLFADVDEFICNYDNAPMRQIRFSVVLSELTTIMRENRLAVPPDLTMLFKALITLEGLGRQLDPDFQIVKHLAPYVKKIIIDRYMPANLLKKGHRSSTKLFKALSGLPGDVSQVLREAARGKLKVNLDLQRLDHFGHQLDHSTNRLTIAMITAALIVGSSIVMTVQGGPTIFGLPAFGFMGFFLAFIIGLVLMISIWRSGRD